MENAKKSSVSTTHAQEVLRIDLEKKKKARKTISRVEKESSLERKFQLKQDKKKQKHKGH